MATRRIDYDPFSDSQRLRPHRIQVVDRLRNPVHQRLVPAGADLRSEFHQELGRWASDGWTIERPFKGACFINRNGVRYHVTISPDDRSASDMLRSVLGR